MDDVRTRQDGELRKAQEDAEKRIKKENERMLADKKAMKERELEAMQGLTSEQKDAILANHAHELEQLDSSLVKERARQIDNLEQRLRQRAGKKAAKARKKAEAAMKVEIDAHNKQMLIQALAKKAERDTHAAQNAPKQNIEVLQASLDRSSAVPISPDGQQVMMVAAGPEYTGRIKQGPPTIWDKLLSIEKKVMQLSEDGGLGPNGTGTLRNMHQDETDRQIQPDPSIDSPVVCAAADLRPASFVLYRFGVSLLEATLGESDITLLIASKLPALDQHTQQKTAYRNSVRFNATTNELYIHQRRLDSDGDFLMCLLHGLAHVKTGKEQADWNDGMADFWGAFLAVLKEACMHLFRTRARDAARPPVTDLSRLKTTAMDALIGSDEPAGVMAGLALERRGLSSRLRMYESFQRSLDLQDHLNDLDTRFADRDRRLNLSRAVAEKAVDENQLYQIAPHIVQQEAEDDHTAELVDIASELARLNGEIATLRESGKEDAALKKSLLVAELHRRRDTVVRRISQLGQIR